MTTQSGAPRTIVVVGASLGGLRTVEALRRQGWDEQILVIGDEAHMPYNRPPLSKKMLLSAGSLEDVILRRQESPHPTEWRLGVEAVSSDLTGRTITLSDGTTVPFDGLVVATGVRPRRLPGHAASKLRHTLRTVDDSIAVSAALTEGARVVIVGAGFIGCEVAAVAQQRGCSVSVVALDPEPMTVPLGTLVGAELRRRHEATGVTFHLGRTVDHFEDANGANGPAIAVLDDGTRLEADVVIEAVGTIPNTDWLADNGLDLDNGVLCDAQMRVDGASLVFAVGDVARFPHPLTDGAPRRIEHVHVPTESARLAAAGLLSDLGAPALQAVPPLESIPTFSSNQGTTSIRAFGTPALANEVTLTEGELGGDAAFEYHRDGEVVAVVLLGMASRAGHFLREITAARAATLV